VGPEFLHLEDIIPAADDDSRGVAVRVAEVTRASLSLTGREDKSDAATAAQRDRRANEQLNIEVDELLTRDALRPGQPKRATGTTLGLGLARLASGGVGATTLDLFAALELSQYLIPHLRALIPIADGHVPLVQHQASLQLSPGTVLSGVRVPVLPQAFPVRAHVGAAIGVAWLGAEVSTIGRPSSTGLDRYHASSIMSPCTAADVAVGVRLLGPIHLAVDGMLGVTASEIAVRGMGEPFLTWGEPFVAASGRVEVVVP
jgi:hypothetical protein